MDPEGGASAFDRSASGVDGEFFSSADRIARENRVRRGIPVASTVPSAGSPVCASAPTCRGDREKRPPWRHEACLNSRHEPSPTSLPDSLACSSVLPRGGAGDGRLARGRVGGIARRGFGRGFGWSFRRFPLGRFERLSRRRLPRGGLPRRWVRRVAWRRVGLRCPVRLLRVPVRLSRRHPLRLQLPCLVPARVRLPVRIRFRDPRSSLPPRLPVGSASFRPWPGRASWTRTWIRAWLWSWTRARPRVPPLLGAAPPSLVGLPLVRRRLHLALERLELLEPRARDPGDR